MANQEMSKRNFQDEKLNQETFLSHQAQYLRDC
uniref:Uncharacterized protein n=1 Tax=Rhizophora mucronata TaxID=61149 RepID=A0A2P2Q9K4_RHIMU